MISNFTPITIDEFATIVAKNNSNESKKEIIKKIKSTLKCVENGETCECGNPIWVAGSAFIDHACFTCITGETDTSEDYEVIEALNLKKV